MSTRVEVNCLTGELTIVPLTQAELDAAAVLKAAEDAANTPDAIAARTVDALDRLWFEVNFQQENRIRVLEGKPPISKATYRDALIAAYKAL